MWIRSSPWFVFYQCLWPFSVSCSYNTITKRGCRVSCSGSNCELYQKGKFLILKAEKMSVFWIQTLSESQLYLDFSSGHWWRGHVQLLSLLRLLQKVPLLINHSFHVCRALRAWLKKLVEDSLMFVVICNYALKAISFQVVQTLEAQ